MPNFSSISRNFGGIIKFLQLGLFHENNTYYEVYLRHVQFIICQRFV